MAVPIMDATMTSRVESRLTCGFADTVAAEDATPTAAVAGDLVRLFICLAFPFLPRYRVAARHAWSMTGPASERCLGKTEGLGKRPGGEP